MRGQFVRIYSEKGIEFGTPFSDYSTVLYILTNCSLAYSWGFKGLHTDRLFSKCLTAFFLQWQLTTVTNVSLLSPKISLKTTTNVSINVGSVEAPIVS